MFYVFIWEGLVKPNTSNVDSRMDAEQNRDKLTAAEELRPELSRPSDPHRNPVIP